MPCCSHALFIWIKFMLRLGLIVSLCFIISAKPSEAQPRTMPADSARSVERFLNGTDADRDVMLRETARSIADNGYSDVALVPWFVMMAKNRKGAEVLLLVDPVSRIAVEIENGPSEAETAAAPETQIPKLRN
jgi:hypothetical protein